MSMPFVLDTIGGFINHAVNRVSAYFIGKELDKLHIHQAFLPRERINGQSQQVEIEYCRGRSQREQELSQIHSRLNNYRDLEVKAGFRLDLTPLTKEHALDISDHVVHLKQQELNLGRSYLRRQAEHLMHSEKEHIHQAIHLRERELQLIRQELMERRKLSYFYLNLMREKEAQAIELKLIEIQANWDKDNWSGILSREEMYEILVEEQQKHRLLMLVSPPNVSQSCPESFIHNLEMDMRSEVKEFLEQHYSLQSDTCPVEFYGKYFKSSVFDTEVRQLESLLAPVPTAVIYSDITDQKVYFHIYFWGLQHPISLTIPWHWELEKQRLEENHGLTERQSLNMIRQAIVKIHQLLAAFLADLYYLNINPLHEPHLFQLKLELSSKWLYHHFGILKKIQQQRWQSYEQALWLLKESQVWHCIHSFNGFHDVPYSLAMAPQGQSLLGSSDYIKTSKLWDIHSGQLRWVSSERFDTFSPDGRWLIRQEDNEIKIGDPNSGKLYYNTFEHLERIDFFTFSPDSLLLVSGSLIEHSLKVWNLDRRTLLYTFEDSPYIIESSVVFSRDGQLMASYSLDKTIRIRDLHSGDLVHMLVGHTHHIGLIAFSTDSQYFASLSADDILKIWNPHTGELLHTLEGQGGFTFSADHQVVLSRNEHASKIWDPWRGKLLKTIPVIEGDIFALGPKGQWLITQLNNDLQLWDLNTGQHLETLLGEFVTFSADRQLIVTKQEKESTGLWQLNVYYPGQDTFVQVLPDHSSTIEQVILSHNNQTLVSRCSNLALKIWHQGYTKLIEYKG